MSPVSVLFASTSFPSDSEDWKGRFIFDMASSLSRQPDISLSIWAPPGRLPTHASSALQKGDAEWLAGLAARGGIAHELRNERLRAARDTAILMARMRRTYTQYLRSNSNSVIHANWLQTALPMMGTNAPVLITVLGSDLALLKMPGMAMIMRRFLRDRKVILAPNAEWMVPELRRYLGHEVAIGVIPFGIHSRWFDVERMQSRIESGKWLVVTRITRSKVGHLLDWGEGYFSASRRLHLIGPMQEKIQLPEWIEWHGPASPEVLARDWFPSITGLLSLSKHDEGKPQVMLEAMAAGIPIVATPLPAHRELLKNGEYGELVGNRLALGESLKRLNRIDRNVQVGAQTAAWVKKKIGTWDDCALRYRDAYRELLM